MMKKEAEQRQAIELLCTDMLVPADHLLRKIDAAVDSTHIYDFVAGLYWKKTTTGSAGGKKSLSYEKNSSYGTL